MKKEVFVGRVFPHKMKIKFLETVGKILNKRNVKIIGKTYKAGTVRI